MDANEHFPPRQVADPVTTAITHLDALYPGEARPLLFRAPGRVNLIGEHTDYNEGFVLPVTIDLEMVLALRPRPDPRLNLRTLAYPELLSLDLDAPEMPPFPWGRYVAAVARLLKSWNLTLSGFDGVLASTLPTGSGLSSSAALTVVCTLAFQRLGGWTLPAAEIAALCRQAEREAVGVRCGIMDPLVICLGKAGHALFIDCRDRTFQAVPLPDQGVTIAVCDSGVPRTLAASAYNQRREECERGVAELQKYLPSIRSLRDVAWKDFLTLEKHLPELLRRRCRHVIGENYRVHNAVTALEAGDLETFGQLFYDSHQSLRDDYAVSGPELDCLVEAARAVPGVLGARLTGAGFGGCTVNLVRTEALSRFRDVVSGRFRQSFQRPPVIYSCRTVDGAGEIPFPRDEPVMRKRRILKEDGRYLLFYEFD